MNIQERVENGVPLEEIVREVRAEAVRVALEGTKGNITRAARRLGVHRNSLMNWRRSGKL